MGPATTAFLLHSAAALHDTGWGHPEHQGRRLLSPHRVLVHAMPSGP